jgi:hypothetical protein
MMKTKVQRHYYFFWPCQIFTRKINQVCIFSLLFMFQISLLHSWKKNTFVCYVWKISPGPCLCIKSVKEFKFKLSISGWEKEGWEKAWVHGGVCERVLRRMERFKLINTCSCLHAVLHF